MPTTTSVVTRPLTTDDAPALAALSERLGGEETASQWAALLARARAVAIGAVRDGRIVGYAAGEVRGGFGMSDDAAWLEAFGIEVAHRGAGIGRDLLGEMLRRSAALGATRAYTLVGLHDQVLAPFFRQVGFREEPLVCLGRAL